MEALDFISTERLQPYTIQTDSLKKAIALHNHTLQLGSSLMSMIALIELSLRNSTNLRIIEDFDDDEWLLPNHTTLLFKRQESSAISKAMSLAQKAKYSKLSYSEKSALDTEAFPEGIPTGMKHDRVVKKRLSLFSVTHGQVISQTTFFFWKRLYSSDYADSLWKQSLKRVFPNKSLKRSDVSKALEVIYSIRNRVSHHEPVYGPRLESAMKSIDFIRQTLGSRGFDDDTSFKKFSRVHYLRLRMDYESFGEAWDTLT